jgi:FKBP-type peptidyl-prolyl cis-trans isomerase (trigger factor)
VAFEVVINQAWRIDPAQVDEVLEQYGTPNEAVFRQQIGLSLEQRAENDQHGAMSAQLFEAILNDMEVPIPERILNHHQKLMHENQVRKLKETGLSSEEIDERLAPQEDRLRESALTKLSMGIIITQLCLQMGLQVDEQEVQDQIALIASSQGRRPEEFRKELVDNDTVNSVFQEVLKIKLARKLFEQVKIIDMDADEWNRVRAGVGDSAG